MTRDRRDAAQTTRAEIGRPPARLIEAARAFSSATLHEAAGKTGALPAAIKPISPAFRVCGPAITVRSPGGDNLWLHRAIYAAQPGDVLVVHASGKHDHGYWGEIMSTAAQVRGLGGLVIDACVRDGDLLAQIGFPVFARGLSIRGTGKDFGALGCINACLLLDDVVVAPGDLILGDTDGAVCIPHRRIEATLHAARQRELDEASIIEQLRAGASTLDVYGWNV
jgi:4-hydroxy-4-methyl-2-oxoglutarate aldolase